MVGRQEKMTLKIAEESTWAVAFAPQLTSRKLCSYHGIKLHALFWISQSEQPVRGSLTVSLNWTGAREIPDYLIDSQYVIVINCRFVPKATGCNLLTTSEKRV
jgi:hypothetical protein